VRLFREDDFSIVPDTAAIAPLRAPVRLSDGGRPSSGFRGVYWYRLDEYGSDVWVAKIKLGGSMTFGVRGVAHAKASRGGGVPVGYSHHPHVCALMLATRYRELFGPEWVRVLAARKLCPWRVRHSERLGGWVAFAWVRGRREEAVWLSRGKGGSWRRTDRLCVYPTEESAKAGLEDYLERVHGDGWRMLLWRLGSVDAVRRAA
jgi:hypothetical protein